LKSAEPLRTLSFERKIEHAVNRGVQLVLPTVKRGDPNAVTIKALNTSEPSMNLQLSRVCLSSVRVTLRVLHKQSFFCCCKSKANDEKSEPGAGIAGNLAQNQSSLFSSTHVSSESEGDNEELGESGARATNVMLELSQVPVTSSLEEPLKQASSAGAVVTKVDRVIGRAELDLNYSVRKATGRSYSVPHAPVLKPPSESSKVPAEVSRREVPEVKKDREPESNLESADMDHRCLPGSKVEVVKRAHSPDRKDKLSTDGKRMRDVPSHQPIERSSVLSPPVPFSEMEFYHDRWREHNRVAQRPPPIARWYDRRSLERQQYWSRSFDRGKGPEGRQSPPLAVQRNGGWGRGGMASGRAAYSVRRSCADVVSTREDRVNCRSQCDVRERYRDRDCSLEPKSRSGRTHQLEGHRQDSKIFKALSAIQDAVSKAMESDHD